MPALPEPSGREGGLQNGCHRQRPLTLLVMHGDEIEHAMRSLETYTVSNADWVEGPPPTSTPSIFFTANERHVLAASLRLRTLSAGPAPSRAAMHRSGLMNGSHRARQCLSRPLR
jgi:hypothetical protein